MMSTRETRNVDFNRTVECLRALRSVGDQLADAELRDLSDLSALVDELESKLADLEEKVLVDYCQRSEIGKGGGVLTVAVVGDFNSGKSTFINGLLGASLCPVGDEPTTASVTYFKHGDETIFEQEAVDGSRTPISEAQYRSKISHRKEGNRLSPEKFYISIPTPELEHIQLVDTPGFDAPPPNRDDTRLTEEAVQGAHAMFVLMDSHKGNPSDSLLKQLDRIRQGTSRRTAACPMFLLINKADELAPDERDDIKNDCKKKHGNIFEMIVTVSAKRLMEGDHYVEPLEALDRAARKIRCAWMAQTPVAALISSGTNGEPVGQIYRIEIDGSEFEVPRSDGLASRQQLSKMVHSVSAKRHRLFAARLQESTDRLRADWKEVMSVLDGCLKGANEAIERNTEPAILRIMLEEIDDVKRKILDCIKKEILEDASGQALRETRRTVEHGFLGLGERNFIDISFNEHEILSVVKDHESWEIAIERLLSRLRMRMIRRGFPWPWTEKSGMLPIGKLIAVLISAINLTAPAFEIKMQMMDKLRNALERQLSKWEGAGWNKVGIGQFEYKLELSRYSLSLYEEGVRPQQLDQFYTDIETMMVDLGREMLDDVIQPQVDRLQESVHVHWQRLQGKSKNMKLLEDRIEQLKEDPPWAT